MKIYRNAVEIYDLAIDSNTKLYQKLMGDDLIKMDVVVDSKLDIRIGDYIVYNSINYSVNRPGLETKISEVEYRYTVQFESPFYELMDKTVLLNGSADFYLTGYLTDFVDLIISNVNEIHSGWTKGTVDTSDWINVYFSNKTCREALELLSGEFDVEFSVVNKTINVRERIENATALTFQHGKGNGLYELSRENVDDGNTVTRVRAFGAKRNIPYDYRGGAKRLIFQNIDGTNYLDNTSEYSRIIEKVITFENIYPRFEGAVTGVSADKLTVTCSTIDFDLNSYLQEGITAKVVFINGDLMGSQFEISNYDNASKSFTLIQGASDGGLIMPRSDTFYANVGDNFVFIDINMPQSYVDAAETKLKNAAQAYLDYYSKLRVKYSLKLDYRYIRDNAITLKIGDVIRVIDTDLGIDKQIRIVGLTPNVDGSGIEAEISNFISEKFEKQVTSQLNDALAEITTIQDSMASNANWFTLLNRPDWTNYFDYDPVNDEVLLSKTLRITGSLLATASVVARVASAVSGDVLANLTANAPLYKPTASSVGLKYNTTQFEVNASNELQIQSGVLAPAAHTHVISDVTGLQTALDAKLSITAAASTYIQLTQKGAANGVAPLNASGKVAEIYLPDSILGQVEYQGTWNPATNTPALPTASTVKGHYYIASADGTYNSVDYKTGDWVISDGTSWTKVDNTDAVPSVFGRTGAILAVEADYQAYYPRLSQAYANPSWISSLAYSKLTGVPDFLLSSSYTAADVLAKIKTVDGAGSGLDADLLDGVHSSGFASITTYTGVEPAISANDLTRGGYHYATDNAYLSTSFTNFPTGISAGGFGLINVPIGSNYNLQIFKAYTSTGSLHYRGSYYTGGKVYTAWRAIWDSANSNLTSIPWSASSLNLAGAITGATSITASSLINSGGLKITGNTVVGNGSGMELWWDNVNSRSIINSYGRNTTNDYFQMVFGASLFTFNGGDITLANGGLNVGGLNRISATGSANFTSITGNGISSLYNWVGASFPSYSTSNITVYDSAPYAEGTGGSITFTGKYNAAGTYLSGAPFIRAHKMNATDGDYRYGLAFGTRIFGGSQKISALLSDTYLTIYGNIKATGAIQSNSLFELRNSSDIKKWTFELSGDDLVLKNASGTITHKFTQAGGLSAIQTLTSRAAL